MVYGHWLGIHALDAGEGQILPSPWEGGEERAGRGWSFSSSHRQRFHPTDRH